MSADSPVLGRRTVQRIFKVTKVEADLLDRGASLARLAFSSWARSTLLREAERLEREQQPHTTDEPGESR